MSSEGLNSGGLSQPESDPKMEALVGRMKQVIEDTSVEGTSQERLLIQTEKSIEEHFSDDTEAFVEYIAWLEGVKDVPDDELAQEAAQRWHDTVIGEFGAKDVEERERAAMGDRHISLNDSNTISYTIDGNTPALHVQSSRELSDIQKVRAIKKAFKELASQIQTKNELSEAKEITAFPWIVREKPKLMERLGFTIDGPLSEEASSKELTGVGENPWRAHISVDDFLNKYAETPKKQ